MEQPSAQPFGDGLTDVDPELWRILLIEDDDVLANKTAEFLARRPVGADGQKASVDVASGFTLGLEKLAATRYDLVILDIRDNSGEEYEPEESAGDEATPADVGISLYRKIRSRRAVPVIFYSAVAHLVSDQANPPFVTVVSKLDEDELALRAAVKAAIDSRLPALNRALNQYTEKVLRTYTQEFVELHWADLQQPRREPDLARMLARRLAISLGDGAGLAAELSSVPGPEPEPSADLAHPMRMYVVPPIGDPTTGDILYGHPADSLVAMPHEPSETEIKAESISLTSEPVQAAFADIVASEHREQSESLSNLEDRASGGEPLGPRDYWVMLTPACDLVGGRIKAEFVVLARCTRLTDADEAIAWLEDPDNAGKTKKLDALLTNNRQGKHQPDRFHTLPPAWDIPGLLVDFQQIVHVPFSSLTNLNRVATLDDPYAQALIARFGRYLGRIGTPNFDLRVVRERLRPRT